MVNCVVWNESWFCPSPVCFGLGGMDHFRVKVYSQGHCCNPGGIGSRLLPLSDDWRESGLRPGLRLCPTFTKIGGCLFREPTIQVLLCVLGSLQPWFLGLSSCLLPSHSVWKSFSFRWGEGLPLQVSLCLGCTLFPRQAPKRRLVARRPYDKAVCHMLPGSNSTAILWWKEIINKMKMPFPEGPILQLEKKKGFSENKTAPYGWRGSICLGKLPKRFDI